MINKRNKGSNPIYHHIKKINTFTNKSAWGGKLSITKKLLDSDERNKRWHK